MADLITVDTTALTSAATHLSEDAIRVESSALGSSATTALNGVAGALGATSTGRAAADLSHVVSMLTDQVVTAVQGLAEGLRVAAATYHQVDVATGQAAAHLGGPAPGHSLDEAGVRVPQL